MAALSVASQARRAPRRLEAVECPHRLSSANKSQYPKHTGKDCGNYGYNSNSSGDVGPFSQFRDGLRLYFDQPPLLPGQLLGRRQFSLALGFLFIEMQILSRLVIEDEQAQSVGMGLGQTA